MRPTAFYHKWLEKKGIWKILPVWQLIFISMISRSINTTKLIRLALNFTFCHYSVIPAFYLLQKVMSFVCQFDASFMEWISYESETFFYTFPSHYYEDNWTIDGSCSGTQIGLNGLVSFILKKQRLIINFL